MRIRTAIALATLLPATFAFGVSGAEAECRTSDSLTVDVDGEATPVEFCAITAFAQCGNAVDPAGKLILPTDGVKLEGTAPTGSFSAGAGCGTVDEPVFGSTTHSASPYQYFMDGFLLDAGNVDTLTFEAHFLGPNLGYTGQEVDVDLRITVDGISIFGDEEGTSVAGDPFTAPKERRVTVVPEVSSTGASSKIRFTVTGISDLDLGAFASEAGAGSKFRQLAIGFGFPHLDTCVATPTNGTERCVPFGPSPLVMGAVEVPTGVTLNAAADTWGVETPAGDIDA